MNKIFTTNSIRLSNYLIENKYYPIYETDTYAEFKRTPQLYQLLEDFQIKYIYFKNKK